MTKCADVTAIGYKRRGKRDISPAIWRSRAHPASGTEDPPDFARNSLWFVDVLEGVVGHDHVDTRCVERDRREILCQDVAIHRLIGEQRVVDVDADDFLHLSLQGPEITSVRDWIGYPFSTTCAKIDHRHFGPQKGVDASKELHSAVHPRVATGRDLRIQFRQYGMLRVGRTHGVTLPRSLTPVSLLAPVIGRVPAWVERGRMGESIRRQDGNAAATSDVSRKRRAVIGMLDQGVYSATNFILTIFVARSSSSVEFGTFSVLVASFLLGSGINRGLSAEPLAIAASDAPREKWRSMSRSAIAVAFLFGVCFAAILASSFALVDSARFFPLCSIFAVALPVLFVQDLLRYAAFAAGTPTAALLNDAAVAVIEVLALGSLVATGAESAELLVAAWAVAGICGALVGLAALGLNPWPTRQSAPYPRRLAWRLGLDNLITQISQHGVTYLVAIIAGLSAAGGFRVAQTVFTPPATLMLGIQAAVTPELVRIRNNSLESFTRAVRRITFGMLAVSASYYVIAVALPDSVGRGLFGESWSSGAGLLALIGVGSIAGSVINVAVAGLRALADGRRTLFARYASVVVIALTIVPGVLIGGAKGAAAAVAVGAPVQAWLWRHQLRLSTTDYRST